MAVCFKKINRIFVKIITSDFAFFVFLTAVSAILLYTLNKDLIRTYLTNQFVGGWDGSGHYAIAKLYAENIFPTFWGWIPNWYNGMPFPQFYPPVFYYLCAVIYKISAIEFDAVFKTIPLLTATLIPVGLSALYHSQISKSKFQSFWVLVLSAGLISAKSELGYVGVSLASSLNNGLVTQSLAFVFLVFWLIFFLDVEKKPANKYYAGAFQFLILLTNVHIAIIAFFIFGLIFILRLIDRRKNVNGARSLVQFICLYFLSGFIPVLIASFWYLPMLHYYDYFAGRPLGWKWGSLSGLYYYHYYFPVFVIISLVFSFIKKNNLIKALGFLMIVANLFLVTKAYIWLPSLPIHIDRWIGTIYFFLPILAVFTFVTIRRFIKIKTVYCLLILIITSYSIYATKINGAFHDDLRGIYIDNVTESIQPILDYMKDKDGLALVEWYTPYEKPSTGVVDAYLGIQGNKTAYSVIRESALSSLFWVPIRNSLSYWPECWGIKCDLAFDQEYLDNPVEDQIKVANFYGIKYLILRSRDQKDLVEDSGLAIKEKDFDDWAIYRILMEPQTVGLPEKEPILVFSDLNTKEIPQRRFDFISLVEEINLKRARTDFTFVYADEKLLDKSEDLKKFKYILIDSYSYENADGAISALKEYLASGGKIIALPSDDKLYEFVFGASDTGGIFLLNDLWAENFEKQYDTFVKLLDDFVEDRRPEKLSARIGFSENVLSADLDIESAEKTAAVPILIKQSYFPGWKSVGGEKIYLAGPGQDLIFAERAIIIYFETPKPVVVGHIISLIGLCLSLIFLLFDARYQRGKTLVPTDDK
ncbi:MAG TPA: hypothetical protein P5328_02540 [Candidatus Paceibacterota bacterium]|nr:hypothetical protein [Candidatus Paceibacterota bacterium]HRZ34322.1 hypothetical protein [Candidatus Paceibacterota bacterium]